MVSAMTENTSALGAYQFDLVQAPIRWQVLRPALVLGVFDVLGEGDSASDVAARLGLKAERTVSFLDALVAMGLLRKTGGVYSPPLGRRHTSLRILRLRLPDRFCNSVVFATPGSSGSPICCAAWSRRAPISTFSTPCSGSGRWRVCVRSIAAWGVR